MSTCKLQVTTNFSYVTRGTDKRSDMGCDRGPGVVAGGGIGGTIFLPLNNLNFFRFRFRLEWNRFS